MSSEWGNAWTTEQTPEWPPRPAESDPGFAHFVRFVGVYSLVTVLSAVVVGIVMQAMILSRTGWRKRDLLLLLVPVYGAVVGIQSTWRVTSRTVYWRPRDDRPSEPFDNGGRGPAIVGWIMGPLFLVGIVVLAAVLGPVGWTSFDEGEFRRGLEGEGVSSAEAECVTNFFVERYPDGPESIPDDENDPTFLATAQEAFAACPD